MEEAKPLKFETDNTDGVEPVPPHLRPLEEKEADIAWFAKFCEENIEPGSLSSLYLEEREALSEVFPGSLLDLGHAGIVKMRVFREDGSSYYLPDDEEADS